MTDQSGNDVLFAASVPSLDTADIGREAGGQVVSGPTRYQETEFNPNPGQRGAPKFYPSGDPIYAVHVDVQTSDRTGPQDDGRRRIYVQGKRLMDAVRTAVRTAGASGIAIGDELYVTKTGTERTEAGTTANTWTARYVTAGSRQIMGQQPPAQQQSGFVAPQLGQPYGQPQHQSYAQPQQPAQQQYAPPAQQQQQQPNYWPENAQAGPPPAWAGQQPQQQPAQQQPAQQQQPAPQQQQQPDAAVYPPDVIAAMRAAGMPVPGQ